MLDKRWNCLEAAAYRLYKDLLLLENYAIMTYCSFSKILKKHDKNTGFVTRHAFMTNIVSSANFANYSEVISLINSTKAIFDEASSKAMEEDNGADVKNEEGRLFFNMIQQLQQLNEKATIEQKMEIRDLTPEQAKLRKMSSGEIKVGGDHDLFGKMRTTGHHHSAATATGGKGEKRGAEDDNAGKVGKLGKFGGVEGGSLGESPSAKEKKRGKG